ncbi:efflux RND transporter periplasmic adaptor subunit [Bizionia sp.]|uniref:efflux RND transporter periplasmic adaptor subunit n=1 Tax=Bizionia sp. TaxID=1954480 RepID=UPI003A8F5CE1
MRKIYILLAATLVLTACGNKENNLSSSLVISKASLEDLRAKKTEVELELKAVSDQLDSINSALAKLDTVKKLPLVTTFELNQKVFNHFLEIQGNVSTKQNVLVYPEMPGILEKVFVKEGQRVKKGDLLARINDGGLGQQLAQLETQAELAKTTFERQQRLWDQKIGSEMQYLQSKTSYISQKNMVAQLKSQIEKTMITAPFDGVIDNVLKEEGTVVAPGMGSEVFRIINLSDMYIEAEVPESYIGAITKGKNVEVFFPILGKTIEAKVRQTSNYINPNNRSFRVEIAIPNPTGEIKPNLTARLKINDYKNDQAYLIPQSIISENADGHQYVYVATGKNKNNEAVVKRMVITTGRTQGDVIEVLNSFEKGVEIIEEGARTVNDGQTVKIINKQ